jgi:hypothetical protein
MYTPYVRISTGVLNTVLDNNPLNTVGCIYSPPANQANPQSTAGFGAQPVVKYVQYKSTSQPTPAAVAAPVYWTDTSFTTVTGNAAEAFSTTGLVGPAGYLLVNTTSVSTLTAAILQSCYVWIQIGGYLAGAYAPAATAIGDAIIGIASGNFVAARSAAGAAPTNRPFGIALSAVSSGTANLLLGATDTTFWGS